MSPTDLIHQLNQFNQSLVDCRQLYLSGAKFMCDEPDAASIGAPSEIFLSMDELHRGY